MPPRPEVGSEDMDAEEKFLGIRSLGINKARPFVLMEGLFRFVR
jgi:hypothetical protein